MFLQQAPPELILWWIAKGNDLVQANLRRLDVIVQMHWSINSNKKESYMGYLFEQFMKNCLLFESIAHTEIDKITIDQIESISHELLPSCQHKHAQIKEALGRYIKRLADIGPFADGDLTINNATIRTFATFEDIGRCFNDANLNFIMGLKAVMPQVLHNIHVTE
jgi:hypothetical protein